MFKDQVKKVLVVLAQAKSPAPLGYIIKRTRIKEPLATLEKMVAEGMVHQTEPSSWSCRTGSMFVLAPATQKELLKYLKLSKRAANVLHE